VAVLISIGGGKGGSGKSFLALNLGVAFAERGREVILLDADLGGANLHTLLGIPFPSVTLEDFLNGFLPLAETAMETSVRGLKLISGTLARLSAKLKYDQKRRLFRNLRGLQADYIIVDLGAGIGPSTLDLFILADRGLLLLTPESTAVENAYRFLRGVYFRCLRSVATERRIRRAVEEVIEGLDRGSTPWDLLKKIEDMDGNTASKFREVMHSLRPYLVLNQLKTRDERALGFSVKTVCKKYFGIDLRYIGYVPFDPKVSYAVARGRPFLWEYPDTETSRCIREIADRMTTDREVTLP